VSRYCRRIRWRSRKRLAFAETLPHEQIDILSGSMVQATLRREAAVANQTCVIDPGFDVRRRVPQRCRCLGIAVVPREAAETFARALALRLVPLTDAWAQRRFVICMRSRESLTAAARLLVDYLCSVPMKNLDHGLMRPLLKLRRHQ